MACCSDVTLGAWLSMVIGDSLTKLFKLEEVFLWDGLEMVDTLVRSLCTDTVDSYYGLEMYVIAETLQDTYTIGVHFMFGLKVVLKERKLYISYNGHKRNKISYLSFLEDVEVLQGELKIK